MKKLLALIICYSQFFFTDNQLEKFNIDVYGIMALPEDFRPAPNRNSHSGPIGTILNEDGIVVGSIKNIPAIWSKKYGLKIFNNLTDIEGRCSVINDNGYVVINYINLLDKNKMPRILIWDLNTDTYIDGPNGYGFVINNNNKVLIEPIHDTTFGSKVCIASIWDIHSGVIFRPEKDRVCYLDDNDKIHIDTFYPEIRVCCANRKGFLFGKSVFGKILINNTTGSRTLISCCSDSYEHEIVLNDKNEIYFMNKTNHKIIKWQLNSVGVSVPLNNFNELKSFEGFSIKAANTNVQILIDAYKDRVVRSYLLSVR